MRACESLHGRSRLIRNGVQIGKYLVPSACRHCDDPKCMNACPTGAVKRRPEGEIYFQYDLCIGCGNCAIACPFDNITMIDTPSFDKAQKHKAAVVGGREFFRPYPVADHDAHGGLLERFFGRRAKHDEAEQESANLNRITAILRPVFRSNAIYATGCHSWDACTVVRPAPRFGSRRRNCSRNFTSSAPSRISARPAKASRVSCTFCMRKASLP